MPDRPGRQAEAFPTRIGSWPHGLGRRVAHVRPDSARSGSVAAGASEGVTRGGMARESVVPLPPVLVVVGRQAVCRAVDDQHSAGALVLAGGGDGEVVVAVAVEVTAGQEEAVVVVALVVAGDPAAPLPPVLVVVGGQAVGGAVEDVDAAGPVVLPRDADCEVVVAVVVVVAAGQGVAEAVARLVVPDGPDGPLLPDLAVVGGQAVGRAVDDVHDPGAPVLA